MAGGLQSVIYDVDHPLTISQYKAYARMMLIGLLHMHQASIMHRVTKIFIILPLPIPMTK